jgi:hypothetical protein
MKRILVILAMLACSVGCMAATYNTSTTLGTTNCISSTISCSASKSYVWANQAVSGSVTLTMISNATISSHDGNIAEVAASYFTNGGCSTSATDFVSGSVTWHFQTDSATITSLTNLSNLCVNVYAFIKGGSPASSASISPTELYVTVTTASGNRVIWWISENGPIKFEINMNPYITDSEMREKWHIS